MKNKPAALPGSTKLRPNLRPLLRYALIVAAYLFGFIILDYFTKQFEVLPGVVTWYPPDGLSFALLLAFGARFAPALAIASLLSSLFIYRIPQPLESLFLWAFLLSLIYGFAAAFLRQRIHIDWQLRKFRDVTWFVFTTVFVSALLAVLSVSGSALGGDIPRSEILLSIFHWWIGETVGILTITPFLLIYVMPGLKRFAEGQPVGLPARRSFPRPTLSAIAQVISLVFILYWIFGVPLLDEFHPLYLITLPLIWIALQHGFKGVTVGIVALNFGVVLALWFSQFDLTRLGELELLMIVNCIVGLLMGAVVTERKLGEQSLHESEEHLRLVTDNMQDLVLRTDLQGLILYASPSHKIVLGYEPEYLVGKSLYDFMHPEDVDRVREFTLTALQAQTTGEQEFRYRHADGHYLWLESTGGIIFNESGLPEGAVFSTRDITERKRLAQEVSIAANQSRLALLSVIEDQKQAEEMLRDSERGLKDAQSLGRLGSWIFDIQSQTINWSDQVYQLYERDPLLGPPTVAEEASYYSPEQARILSEYSKRAIAEGLSFDYDLEVDLTSGKHLSFSAKMQPVKDASGRVVRLFGTIHDITDRKQAEEAVQEQLAELQRWHNATLGRETRLLDLKREVNELLVKAGLPPRYSSVE